MAVASALQWEIAKSLLPLPLKATCWALSLKADSRQGYANIFFSKETVGRYTSRGERAAREDMSDLVRFGVLTIVEQSRGGVGVSTVYQMWFDRLAAWSADDTRQLAELRRARRPGETARSTKTRIARSGFSGSKRASKPGSSDPQNPDRSIRRTRIERSGEGTYSESTDLKVRSASAVEHLEHAGATSSAIAAQPLAEKPRPNSAAYHVLIEIGQRLLAENGSGEVDWTELRSGLKAGARRIGIQNRADNDLLNRVEDSLREQRRHFLDVQATSPAAPPEKTPVRPANEVEL